MFCIFNLETTRFVRVFRNGCWSNAHYKTRGAAVAAFNRMEKDGKINRREYGIDELEHFHKHVEKIETKRNLLTGREFTQPVNTPMCADPSTETYHSM